MNANGREMENRLSIAAHRADIPANWNNRYFGDKTAKTSAQKTMPVDLKQGTSAIVLIFSVMA